MSEDDRPCRCPNSFFSPHRVTKCPLQAARAKAAAVASFGQSIGSTAANAVFQRSRSTNTNAVTTEDVPAEVIGEFLVGVETEIMPETNIGDEAQEDSEEREAIQRKVDQFLQSQESGGLEYSELGDNGDDQPTETSPQRRPRPVIRLGKNISKFLSTVPGIISAPVNSVSNTVSSSVSKGVKTVATTIKKGVNLTQQQTEKEDSTTPPSNPILARSKQDENINFFLLTAVISAVTAWFLTAFVRIVFLMISFVRLPYSEFQLMYAQTFILPTSTQTAIIMLLMLISYHRVLGAVGSLLLKHHLQPAHSPEIYNIHIGWIAYRGGFDHHEIVFHDICWRNHGAFSKTPFLMHTVELSVSFDFINLLDFVYNGTVLQIGKVMLDGLELYFEKSDDPAIHTAYPLNIWAALGIRTEQTKSTTLDKLFMRMLRVIRNKLLYINVNVPNLGLKSMIRRRGGNKKGRDETGGGDELDDEEDDDEATGEAVIEAVQDEETFLEADEDIDSSLLLDEDEEEEAAQVEGPEGQTAASAAAIPIKSGSAASTQRGDAAPARKIYIDINRLTAFDLNIHPLDLLSSTHMESTKGSDLRLDEFIFHRKDATIRRPGHRGGGRRVLPVDLMINRLVEQLALKLLAANTMSIAGMMGGSTANNISSTVSKIFKR